MLTDAAAATAEFNRDTGIGVFSRRELVRMGCTRATLAARLASGRWQRIGKAVVLHNFELSPEQRWAVGVVNCGPRAVLASFSAVESLGLTGWSRHEVHVLAPTGVARPHLRELPVILHRTDVMAPHELLDVRRCQRIGPALVLAAGSFAKPRPACGILAAGVQQRLTDAAALRATLSSSAKVRHRRLLLAAVDDIEMGAQALSEIDFVRLCRRNGLPPPDQQAVRGETTGRRRYLDAEWSLGAGRRVVVEVDGAIHLEVRRWVDDQLRQNEVALARTLVLRYPSVVIRTDEALVVNQLRRALATP